jgi:hypothetical protein
MSPDWILPPDCEDATKSVVDALSKLDPLAAAKACAAIFANSVADTAISRNNNSDDAEADAQWGYDITGGIAARIITLRIASAFPKARTNDDV